ncbi:MAG: hypothetical protein GY861_16480 [bacterium]|nr:hypothetical protein [bacterium]
MSKENLFDRVRRILLFHPQARDSYEVLEMLFYPSERPLREVLLMIRDKQLPSFESLHRARRKVAEQHPELAGKTKKLRDLKEEDIRYSINTKHSEQAVMSI